MLLAAAGIAGAASLARPRVAIAQPAHTQNTTGQNTIGQAMPPHAGIAARILILLELSGGNDTLNTVIPIADKGYYQARPRLAIARDQSWHIADDTALHPALRPLAPLWQQQHMAIVQGLGYPAPNRSHFRSIEIWDTASRANEYKNTGWIHDLHPKIPRSTTAFTGAVSMTTDPGPLLGMGGDMITIGRNTNALKKAASLQEGHAIRPSHALAHILTVRNSTSQAARQLLAATAQAPTLSTDFPKTKIGRAFEHTARMIAAGLYTPFVKISHGSFDTHQNQSGTHARLLEEMAAAIAAFHNAMHTLGRWQDIAIMTYSEFGRRVRENGSQGTDHGTAATHFVFGGAINGGLYGHKPPTTQLDKGDLRYTTDFRAYYATLARDFLGAAHAMPEHRSLNFIRL
jgi:uncharacterized protein (DUF1501 family)